MLKTLRRSADTRALAWRLCAELVAQARRPEFFTALAVPDTLDGRFDLVALHGWLVLDSVRKQPALSRALIDEVFLQFEEALRHLGTGDAGMNRRLKTLAGMFYGRLDAYRNAATPNEMSKAIQRNVFRGAGEREPQASALAAYIMAARSRLAERDPARQPLDFGPVPTM
ncbi:MAG TPA: ubiquinol-cytochrome C chaperone family protein [Rhizomicrobium sp.]|nr:ubiquinol-cytochrome C chaperone family protein [Rhizomicrobium sp.]